MAYVRFTNNTSKHLTNEQGLALWEVLQGRTIPTKQQEQWCLHIDRLYLDIYSAPEDYVQKYKNTVYRHALGDYMCDRSGNLTKPEWSRKQPLDFVKRHSLDMQRVKQLYPRG